jgi:hypothetical protein
MPAPARPCDGKALRDEILASAATLPHPFRWIHMRAIGRYEIALAIFAQRFLAFDPARGLVIGDTAAAAIGIAWDRNRSFLSAQRFAQLSERALSPVIGMSYYL